MRSQPTVVVLGLLALAVLAWFCIGRGAPAIEADLGLRGAALLHEGGFESMSLSLDGRDGTLVGSAATAEQSDEAISALASLHGLRRLDSQVTVAAPVPDNDTGATVVAPEEPEPAPSMVPEATAPEAAPEAPTPEAVPAAADMRRLLEEEIRSLGRIEFVTSSSDLPPAAQEVLAAIAVALSSQPAIRVEIAGHADSTGTHGTNQPLSERRATAVRDYLIGRGIAGSRLETVGYGEDRPTADNSTSEGRRRNRRTEFRILER